MQIGIVLLSALVGCGGSTSEPPPPLGPDAGWTLIAPMSSTTTYLFDSNGECVHEWQADLPPGTAAYLLDDGTLLRAADSGSPNLAGTGAGGLVEAYAWDGSLLWSVTYDDETHRSHHDLEPLPNGNVLLTAWELIPAQQALAAGRDPLLLDSGELWPDEIVEVTPGGDVVWRWRVWDHIVQDRDPEAPHHGSPADAPGRIDLNHVLELPLKSEQADLLGAASWTHVNSLDYDARRDLILLSSRGFQEIWIIDHGLSTQAAAGPAGDLLFRWGNPAAYGRGTFQDQQLFVQHDAQWVDAGCPGAGNILVFNNGTNRGGGSYSSVIEIDGPRLPNGDYPLSSGTFAPPGPIWTYTADPPSSMYAAFLSGAQRLANGNTLICNGVFGELREVTPLGGTVWTFTNPMPSPSTNRVFKVQRIREDHPVVQGLLSKTPPAERGDGEGGIVKARS